MDDEERLQRALELAYRYLNTRDRTVEEMRRQLERRGVPGDTAGRVLEILSAQHYLDDHRYARLFIEDKRALEQWGTERIRRTLLTRGLERGLIEEEIAAADDPPTDDPLPGEPGEPGELGRALELLHRRFPTPPRDRRERERALGVLLRKGYDSELALDALSSYARDTEEPSFS